MAQFVNPSVVLLGDRKASPRELSRLLRQSIAAEEEAVHLYEFIADITDLDWVKKVFQDVADEEKVHVGEFQAVLNRLLDDEEGFLEEGADEVAALSGGDEVTEKSLLPLICEILEKSRVRKKPRYKIKHMWKALEDAASRRRKCFLRYKKLKKNGGGTFEYYIAPYSFRNKPGGEVLFAYDFVDGHIKSFFKERVTGVHVTGNRFVPKWDVEVGSEKSLSVYESFRVLGEIAKEKSGKTRTLEDFMNEGLSSDRKVTPDKVDPEQLRMGIEVEFEHTKDPELARKIALDHLAEFPFYYTALADMERRLKGQKAKEATEKDSVGSPPAAKEAVKSPKPKIVKPSASLRP